MKNALNSPILKKIELAPFNFIKISEDITSTAVSLDNDEIYIGKSIKIVKV